MKLFFLGLLFLNLQSVEAKASCEDCEKIKKKEAILIEDADFYRTRTNSSEKLQSKLVLLKDLGTVAKEINVILAKTPVSDETVNELTYLLAKVDTADNEHILLERINEELKPYHPKVKAALDGFLKAKKITKDDYTSMNESLNYVEEAGE